MFQSLNTKSKNKFFISIKFLSIILVIYLFYKFINTGDFILILSKIAFKDILVIYLIYLSLPILLSLRWFIIVKNFTKFKFIDLLKNIISGFSFSLILSSALVIDAAKFLKVKKAIGTKKSLVLVSIDKLLALIFKILFLFLFLILYLFFLKEEIIYYPIFAILVFVLLLFLFIKSEHLIIFICKIFLKKNDIRTITSIFSKIKKNIIKLIFANLIIQLVNILIYFLIFLSLGGNLSFFNLLIIVPIIELLGQFSFIILGIKELSTVLLLGFFDINKELALAAALIYLFLEYIVVITLYIIFNLIKK